MRSVPAHSMEGISMAHFNAVNHFIGIQDLQVAHGHTNFPSVSNLPWW